VTCLVSVVPGVEHGSSLVDGELMLGDVEDNLCAVAVLVGVSL